MKLKLFKKLINDCVKRAGKETDPDIRFFVGTKEFCIKKITQGRVVANVEIILKKLSS